MPCTLSLVVKLSITRFRCRGATAAFGQHVIEWSLSPAGDRSALPQNYFSGRIWSNEPFAQHDIDQHGDRRIAAVDSSRSVSALRLVGEEAANRLPAGRQIDRFLQSDVLSKQRSRR